MKSPIVTKTSKIINHAYSEGRHLVTLDPDLGVEFEMGSSKATLSPPKGSGGEKVEAVVGFHVYPALQQVLSVGDVEKDSKRKAAAAEGAAEGGSKRQRT